MKKKEPTNRFAGFIGTIKTSEQPTPSVTPSESDRSLSKGKDPEYQRTTVYLPKTLHRKLKAAALEDEREMSEIIEELIEQWLTSRHSDV